MAEPADIAETRESRMLRELAELSMGLARDLQARALAAETAEDAARLASAFQRIARGVRQTLALEAKLAQDSRRLVREELTEAQRASPAQIARRRGQVEAAVARLILDAHESPESEELLEMLDWALDDLVITDDFMIGPVEVQVARICRALDLAPRPTAGPGTAGPGAVHGPAVAICNST